MEDELMVLPKVRNGEVRVRLRNCAFDPSQLACHIGHSIQANNGICKGSCSVSFATISDKVINFVLGDGSIRIRTRLAPTCEKKY